MLRQRLSAMLVYMGFLAMYGRCKDLECKLALKTMECETYKTLINTCNANSSKGTKKKDRDD